jgi:hypothetical protein
MDPLDASLLAKFGNQLPKGLSHRERVAEENRRLKKLLKGAFAKAGVDFGGPSAKGKAMQLLDIACGECREAGTLIEVAREVQAGGEVVAGSIDLAPVRFIGTDLRLREVGMAADAFKGDARTQADFLVEDASQLHRHAEIGEGFDLAFLRHQNFWHDRKLWKRIFAQGLAKLSPEGHLVITSYFDEEHRLALAAMKEIGAELVVTERNVDSIELDYPGKTVDRHVAVFRRK